MSHKIIDKLDFFKMHWEGHFQVDNKTSKDLEKVFIEDIYLINNHYQNIQRMLKKQQKE